LGTLSSVAAALVFWAPSVFVTVLARPGRLSVLVEIATILIMVPLFFQNRVYHLWLFRAIIVATNLEDIIFDDVISKQRNFSKDQTLLTYGLTGLNKPAVSHWKTMIRSNLFWNEVLIFLFLILAASILAWAFQTGLNRNRLVLL